MMMGWITLMSAVICFIGAVISLYLDKAGDEGSE